MNKLFTIILVALLSLPVCVWAVDENASSNESISVVNMLDEEVIEQEKVELAQYKQPISKKKIAKKFLAAMGGVGVSSFLIFLLLTIYNRVRENYMTVQKSPNGETSLETPDDLDSAVRTFLDKTKW